MAGRLFVVLFDVRYLMTKVSPPRLTLLFSTSICHSSDIDIQNWSEESSGVQGFKKENPSVKTGFGKEKQESVCACWLPSVLVILSWLRKGCEHKGIWCQSGGDHSAQCSSVVLSFGRVAGLMCECGLLFVSGGL